MMEQPASRQERRSRLNWAIVFLALLVLSVACLGLSLLLQDAWASSGPQFIGVTLHSVLSADYSADKLALSVPAAQISLIQSAIQDQQDPTDLPQRMATLVGGLTTLVPTVTPFPTLGGTLAPTSALTPTQPPTLFPSASPTLAQTATPSWTPFPTATSGIVTLQPTARPTNTPGQPPATRTSAPPTRTSAPPPTRTPAPPPTRTPAPPPTRTPVPPPTSTPGYPPPGPTQPPYP